jgi:ankyrin repeat protein
MKTELIPDRTNAEAQKTQRSAEKIIRSFLCVPLRPLRLCVSPPLAALLLCVLTLIPAAGHAATNDLTALLQQGLFEEQANRNLDAAIEDYAALAKQFDKDRQLAATAVFRLGECYRAQGKTNEAAAQYQRILRDFPDQKTLVTLSRQDLAGMGAAKSETAAAENSEAQIRERLMWKRLNEMPKDELEKILPTLVPDATLDDLLQKRNEAQAQRALLAIDYSITNLNVVRKDVMLAELKKQIEEKIGGMMEGLKLRAELPASVSPAGGGRQQQKNLLAQQIALAEQDLVESEKLVQLGKATTADSRSAAQKVLRLRQEQAALDGGKTELLPLTAEIKSEEDQEIARIQTMIQNSPDLINAPGEGGNTPLTQSAYKGWLKVATYLIEHGADVNLGGMPALSAAAAAGNRAMVELLLSRGANVNSKDSHGKTALHIAAEKEFPTVAEVLLANKADANAQDNSGNTPLFSAANNGSLKLVAMLLAAGANPNLPNKQGLTPLVLPAAHRSSEIVKALLAAGANPNVERDNGRTPLSYAVEGGSPETVKVLLAAKADPNGGKLDAPLLPAIYAKDAVSAELLLQAGANPNVAGQIDLPVRPNSADLMNHSGHLTPLWLTIYMKQLPMVNLLLKFKADPDDSQTDGRPLLFSALTDTNLLETLLMAGAKVDPTLQDETEWTPLAAAVSQNNAATTAILLKHGANPNVRNRNGATPLHWAAGYMVGSNAFELLLANKADPNARNSNGQTPLDLLKQFHNASPEKSKLAGELADLLRQNGALDELPDFTRIRITRQGLAQALEVFRKGERLTNHFTLLETVMRFYSLPQVYFSGQGNSEAWRGLPFPDFGRVIIRRPSQKIGGKEQEIKVSLLNSSNVVDCAQDVPVEFGDVIEIPESVHALNAAMPNPVGEMEMSSRMGVGLNAPGSFAQRLQAITEANASPYRAAAQCLQKSVQLVVAGETTTFKVNSWKEGFLSQALGKTEARSALRSSSDLSRMQVTHKTGKSAKPVVFIVDVSDSVQRNDDLWLQDGDVIEVPEKR